MLPSNFAGGIAGSMMDDGMERRTLSGNAVSCDNGGGLGDWTKAVRRMSDSSMSGGRNSSKNDLASDLANLMTEYQL